jgi:hypothetical protein
LEHLNNLLEDEKAILRGYFEEKTRSRWFRLSNGSVATLENLGILVRMTSISRSVDSFSFSIVPWAYEHLEKNPGLLRAAT